MMQAKVAMGQSPIWGHTWRMFISPSEVLASLEHRWSWVPAWFVAVVITAICQIPAAANYLNDMRELVLSGEVSANVVETQKWLTLGSNTLNSPLALLGQALLCGGILSFVNLLYSTAPRQFGRWYSLAMWSSLPAAVGSALFKGLLQLTYHGPATMVFSGPALLLSGDERGLFKSLLVTLDIFTVCYVCLCCLGVYLLNKRHKSPAIACGSLLFLYHFAISYVAWR